MKLSEPIARIERGDDEGAELGLPWGMDAEGGEDVAGDAVVAPIIGGSSLDFALYLCDFAHRAHPRIPAVFAMLLPPHLASLSLSLSLTDYSRANSAPNFAMKSNGACRKAERSYVPFISVSIFWYL